MEISEETKLPSYSLYTQMLANISFTGGAGKTALAATSGSSDLRTVVPFENGKYQFYYLILDSLADMDSLEYYDTSTFGHDIGSNGIYDSWFNNLPSGNDPSVSSIQEYLIQNTLHTALTDVYSTSFDDVANIAFNVGTHSNADIVFGQTDVSTSNSAVAYSIDYNLQSIDLNGLHDDLRHGDIWLNSYFVDYWDSPEKGGFGLYSVLHEVGHSLGVDHPIGNSDLDSVKYTVMSTEGLSGMYDGTDTEVMPAGLQIFDIAALQEIYGVNYQTRVGNTVYDAGGAFASARQNDAFIYTIWDGEGSDQIDASGYSDNVIIDLRQGHFSSIGKAVDASWGGSEATRGSDGLAIDNVAIAFHTIIEKAKGTNDSTKGDVLIGNLWSNELVGLAGDDLLYGEGYVRDGTDGFNEVDEGNPDGYAPDSDNDILDPGTGADQSYGGFGNDTFLAVGTASGLGLEGDKYHGGGIAPAGEIAYNIDGFDTVDFSAVGYGLTIDISDQADGWAERTTGGVQTEDELISIEGLITTAYDDIVTGNASTLGNEFHTGAGEDIVIAGDTRNAIYGGAGDDTLTGGSKRDTFYSEFSNDSDTIAGGKGYDVAHYGALSGGISVIWTAPGTATVDKGMGDDTLSGIEEVVGTAGADTFETQGHRVVLSGGGGSDVYTLQAGAAQETIHIYEVEGVADFNEIYIKDVADEDVVIERLLNGDMNIYLDGTADGRPAITVHGQWKEATHKIDRVRVEEPGGGSPIDHDTADRETYPSSPKAPPADPADWPVDDVNPNVGNGENTASPLVLDLGGNGIELTALGGEGSVYWDLDADGMAEATGWVAPTDGLLALDWNDDGIVTDHTELFGTEHLDGFIVLAGLDTNEDDTINASDAAFNRLLVWKDANSDGYSQSSELFTLSALNITSINLDFDVVGYSLNGNPVRSESTFVMNGQTRTIEPLRVCRRPFLLSHAAMAGSSSMA